MMNAAYVVFVMSVVVTMVSACTIDLPPGARSADRESVNDNDDVKIYYSDVVVFGQVGTNVSGAYPLSQYDGIYTVEFDVLCSYKGGKIPETIFIAGMGNMNDVIPECPRISVKVSPKSYQIMFLKTTSMANVFEVEFKPNQGNMEDIELFLDDLTINCGLELHNPLKDVCMDFEPLAADECQPYVPPTIPPTVPTTKPTTEKVKVEVGDGSNNQSDQPGKNGGEYNTPKPTDKTGGEVGQVGDNAASWLSSSMLLTTVLACLAPLV